MTAMRRPWFLSSSDPDVLELLRDQVRLTDSSLRALAEWSASGGDAEAMAVRAAEHEGDAARRALTEALREALSAPLDQEDIYTVSDRLDTVQNIAKNVVRQAQLAGWTPDEHADRMAACARAAVGHLVEAFDALPGRETEAGEQADAAIKSARGLEKAYRGAIAALAASSEPAGRVALAADLYRRYDSLGDAILAVCHRVWYSVMKEA
jgi:hypothetical protein